MELSEVLNLVRTDIAAMSAYSSARSLASDGDVRDLYLDANEAPIEPFPGGENLNRYDSQQPPAVLNKLAELYRVEPDNIMMSRGSDEAIDIIIRTFCNPGSDDSIVITPPTFGMYAQHAAVNATKVISVSLDPLSFAINKKAIFEQIGPKSAVKVVFLCSPNNPTGTVVDMVDLVDIIQKSNALVVVDEAYIEYYDQQKLMQLLPFNPQLILLRTMSKARALAGIRLGCAIGHKAVIAMLRKVLPAYPMTRPSMDVALRALSSEHQNQLQNMRNIIIDERERMSLALKGSLDVDKIWPSATNFLLVRVKDPDVMMQKAAAHGIILRDLSGQIPRAIRVTLGMPQDNDRLLDAWGVSVQSV